MALSILDGNQSATTLSTILSSGQHITAHTVVSLGTQAIADIVNATSAGLTNTQLRASAVTIAGTVTVNSSANFDVRVTQGGDPVDGNNAFPVYGTVTANVPITNIGDGIGSYVSDYGNFPISGTVTANIPLVNIQPNVTTGLGVILLTDEGKSVFDQSSAIPATLTTALPTGTNRIGVVTIGAGTVTLGASTAQIGSVTASISGTVPISISSVTVGNSVTIGSLPAISGTVTVGGFSGVSVGSGALLAGGLRFGSVAALTLDGGTGYLQVKVESAPAISGTVTANTFAVQGTAVTTSNFTSTTASTVLANFNATREVLTIFNEGSGNLHICAGATCTTIAYQVRLSAGDYYEVPNHQTSLTHSAVFATAGTARIVQIS